MLKGKQKEEKQTREKKGRKCEQRAQQSQQDQSFGGPEGEYGDGVELNQPYLVIKHAHWSLVVGLLGKWSLVAGGRCDEQ